ncbi:hypothetical protein TanjilG_26440 [Lupinus angustifolius]|uniref:Uncharacterized protein n=1 Tax=Lupinus angustifolius TaxID=3871 RepID=A0A4P1R3Q3_LUPAN|nr:hypothetical protein TanjilG_26440 [Lupinus angustifolius]
MAIAVTVPSSSSFLLLINNNLFNFPSSSTTTTSSSSRWRGRRGKGRISALFWGSKNNDMRQEQEEQFSLSSTVYTDLDNKESSKRVINVSVVSSISDIPSTEWDACAVDASGGHEKYNPFISHSFLSSLEHSGSAVKETGWTPHHLLARMDSTILAVVPLYLKTHSYGEFVFDHSWANAYYSYGSPYYPKFQSCVPFTPVTGPRILLRNSPFKDQVFHFLLSALKHLTAHSHLSSLHVTFPSQDDFHKFTQQGFLPRIGIQYHWKNRNYKNSNGVLLLTLSIMFIYWKAKHWDSFYSFYRNTTDNKWGTPYLTRDFFHEMGSKMGDQVLLVVAEEGGELVAGALNLIGGDTLFGRLWGCQPQTYYPSLHFEACYYQAIEAAIELNLETVEAGAQGEHKIQRGYLPVTTYSCHYLVDEEFRKAIQNFIIRESSQEGKALIPIVMEILGIGRTSGKQRTLGKKEFPDNVIRKKEIRSGVTNESDWLHH